MIIVIEGLPGAGKTTALHRLKNRGGFTLVEEILTSEPQNATEDFYLQNDIDKYAQSKSTGVYIFDRNFVSTLCYNYCSDKIRHTVNFPYVARKINIALGKAELHQPDAYIYLYCSVSTSKNRQNIHNDPFWRTDSCLRAASGFYSKHFKKQTVPVLKINTELHNSVEVAKQIENFVTILSKTRKYEELYV